MAVMAPSNYEYQQSMPEKVVSSVKKRAPFFIGRLVQAMMYGLFQVVRFIQQMIVDAIGK